MGLWANSGEEVMTDYCLGYQPTQDHQLVVLRELLFHPRRDLRI